MHEALGWPASWPASPLNLSLLLALAASAGVYLLLWRTAPVMRCVRSASSARAPRPTPASRRAPDLLAMAISGALAGLVGMNEIAGVQARLLLDYVAGAGFTGIAVALIGRNHPVGIVLASLLFGALYQGGAELAFEVPGFSRDMVFTLQGLIVLFSGRDGLCRRAGAGAPVAEARPWMRR
jgi:general nucleoside transport system permease protein